MRLKEAKTICAQHGYKLEVVGGGEYAAYPKGADATHPYTEMHEHLEVVVDRVIAAFTSKEKSGGWTI